MSAGFIGLHIEQASNGVATNSAATIEAPFMDILSLDATGQLKALKDRQISARELLDASIARADRLNSLLNAIVAREVDRAFLAAREIDKRRIRGEPVGLLAGLPMTVKEAFDVEGLPACAGVKDLLARNAKDAAVVQRVRSADALVWGKTNTPVNSADWQSYNPVYGTTNNPWDIKRTPGGSSGGSAVAVATGMTALEIGADLGGSLRIPASFCGVFAHKPTYGIVPQLGYVPPVNAVADMDMAVIGPMARSARDLRLLLSIIADSRFLAEPEPLEVKGLKIALWIDEPGLTIDPETKTVLAELAKQLEMRGAIVEPVQNPLKTREMMFAYATLLLAVIGFALPWLERSFYELLRWPAIIARGCGAGPLSWAHGALGVTARHREWLAANEMRAKLGLSVGGFFSRFDFLLAPSAPVAAFPHNHAPMMLRRLNCSDGRSIKYLEMLDWVAFATMFGLPATAVPAGLTRQGLPVGAQVIGPRGRDSLTLTLAQIIDDQLGGFRPPPCIGDL